MQRESNKRENSGDFIVAVGLLDARVVYIAT
jgi:hypothetical protein